MVTLVNRAKMGTATTGTGTITLGSAESGYQSFANAGVTDGQVVRYVIEDGSNWEIGTGTYTASGTTLSRTVSESSNSDAEISLSGSAVVYVSATAAHFIPVDANGDFAAPEEFKAKSYNETYATVSSSSGSLTINCENGNVFALALSENVTSTTFSNPPASGTAYGFTLKVTQDSTARTITWPASVDWPAATAPTLSTGSGEVDVFVFFTHDGGTIWYGFTAGQDVS
jgi:hypothetical protein